mmetsp:Transcript_10252/g.28139  ORF Transcript_10252/g.28139 Transcript_10252/m.28139 type:complete len:316 (-) Transcript_10252:1695-2642(-)
MLVPSSCAEAFLVQDNAALCEKDVMWHSKITRSFHHIIISPQPSEFTIMLTAKHKIRNLRNANKAKAWYCDEYVLTLFVAFSIGFLMGCNGGTAPEPEPVPAPAPPVPPSHPLDGYYASPLPLDSRTYWKECDDAGLLAVKRHVKQWGKHADMNQFRLLLRGALKSIGRSDPQLDMNELYVRRIYAAVGGDIDAYYGELVTTFGFWHDGRHDPFGADARKDIVELVEKGMSMETLTMYVQVGASHTGLYKHLSVPSRSAEAHCQILESQRLMKEKERLESFWFYASKNLKRVEDKIAERMKQAVNDCSSRSSNKG